MLSILKTPSHVAKLGRHGHDMSRRILFTSSVGHLLPVMFDFLSPGDKVRINEQLYTRTAPLTSPAFCRIKEHVEYFFVPMEQINSYFGQAFYGISDLNSSSLMPGTTSTYNNELPPTSFGCTIDQLVVQLFIAQSSSVSGINFEVSQDGHVVWNSEVSSLSYDMFGIPCIFNFVRLLDMLGYGHNFFNQSSTAQGQGNGLRYINLDAFFVYQKIYYDYYRNSQFEGNSVFNYNYDRALRDGLDLDESGCAVSIPGGVADYTSSVFTLRYRPLKKDFFTNVLSSPLYSLNPHAEVNPNSYNNKQSASSNINSYILSAYGVQLQNSSVTDGSLASNSGVSNDALSGVVTEFSGSVSGAATFNNIQQMRLAFAYDKMMSITQRAGKHYDDQTLAHFGVKVPQGISGECYFLGGHTSDLNIAEVVATAAGTNEGNTSSLGELAGRGYGASNRNKDIKFTAPCHGYIMAIYSACPEISYSSFGLNRLHTYCSINDFPHPEFDNIGMQPLWLYQINNSSYYNGDGNYTPLNAANFYGWQYRWSELKMSYDVTSTGFVDTLQNWAVNYLPGQFSSFGYLLSAVYKRRNNYLANFYCSPDLLDNIFALSYSPINWWSGDIVNATHIVTLSEFDLRNFAGMSIESTSVDNTFLGQKHRPGVLWDDSIVYSRDPLYHSIDFKYYKTSWMSTYGLPSL